MRCARPCAVMSVRLLRLALRAGVSLRGAQYMFVFPARSSGGCAARRLMLRCAQAFKVWVDLS
ncbi:hypothetical protein A2U01_0063998 [Trifolium medium]|uniref:Uncharacterized protein n=1 Tax=Trifolium medium TaxID=97028 RepID=A0A392S1L1_9FABA|nr:hypothetical protein [Trifolium medium]